MGPRAGLDGRKISSPPGFDPSGDEISSCYSVSTYISADRVTRGNNVQIYEVAQITRIIFENAFLGIPEQGRSREYFERNDCQQVIGRCGKIRCQKRDKILTVDLPKGKKEKKNRQIGKVRLG